MQQRRTLDDPLQPLPDVIDLVRGGHADANPVRPVVRNAARQIRDRYRPDTPGRIRTCDLALRRRALYPLSYGRMSLRRDVRAGEPPADLAA